MKKRIYTRAFASTLMMWSLAILPLAAVAQHTSRCRRTGTKCRMTSSSAAMRRGEVARQFPLLNDNQTEAMSRVSASGSSLRSRGIPAECI